MTYRSIHPQFNDTFAHYSDIPEGIRIGLWNYLAYGLEPGGFAQGVLENNFLKAATRADHAWNGNSFKNLAKWLINTMPPNSYGNKEIIESWMEKTDEERRDIMIEFRLRPSVIDILMGAPA